MRVISVVHLVNRLVCRVIYNDYVLCDVLHSAVVDNLVIFWRLLLLYLLLHIGIISVIIIVWIIWWGLIALNYTVVVCPPGWTHIVVLGKHAQVRDQSLTN